MKNSDIYLRFLALAHAVDVNFGDEVDLVAQRLLEVIAVSASRGTPFTVSQAMELKSIASPATLHRKLRALMDRELIVHKFEGKNRRTRYLVPTENAEKHFQLMGTLVESLLPA
jgi:DNA-binding MarR family transcriptional regulator